MAGSRARRLGAVTCGHEGVISGARWLVTIAIASAVHSTVQGDNPPIDGLWARPYGPPPNWARFLRAPPVWTIFMALTDLVVPQAVVPSLRVNSKKQALQE